MGKITYVKFSCHLILQIRAGPRACPLNLTFARDAVLASHDCLFAAVIDRERSDEDNPRRWRPLLTASNTSRRPCLPEVRPAFFRLCPETRRRSPRWSAGAKQW